jgi:hypothetical protein
VTNRPQLRDALTAAQIEALLDRALERADKGDSVILKFLLEQIYGKAPQPLTGAEGGPIQIQGVEITVRKK